MKKIISLALAIIMIMMIGVVAFADKTVHFVELKPVEKEPTKLIDIEEYEFRDEDTGDDRIFYSDAEGGTYYLVLEDEDIDNLKDLRVESNNTFVDASLVDFDCKKMTFDGIKYGMKYRNGDLIDLETSDYDEAVEKATEEAKIRKSTYTIVAVDYVEEKLVEVKPTLVKLVVAKNYGVTYEEAKVKVTATRKTEGKKVNLKAEFKVVTDVVFFDKEEVEYCANNVALTVGDDGHSSYDEHDTAPATVIAKTSFRAIEGKKIEVENGDNGVLDWTVKIDKVPSGQPSVNFMPLATKFIDKAGDTWTDVSKEKLDTIKFGFPAKQTINSDFTVEFDFDFTYGELLKAFGGKLEEEDVVDYFVHKDGKVIDKISVDYSDTKKFNEKVEFVVKCKAGETLGVYEIKTVGVYEAKEVKEETETNPDTGAPVVLSVAGAIACLALVAGASLYCRKH